VAAGATKTQAGWSIQQQCSEVADKCTPQQIVLRIPADLILMAAIDAMRANKNAEAVAALSELVKTMKAGQHRKILATMHVGARTKGEIYDAAEKLVRVAERNAGG
jgi:hypothetical protein